MLYFIFTVFEWQLTFPLHRLRYKKYFSIALNDIYYFAIKSKKVLPKDNIPTVVWIHDNYNRYKQFIDWPAHSYYLEKLTAQKVICYKIDTKNRDQREYYLIAYGHGVNMGKIKRTWAEAADKCKNLVDGYLPWFESRSSLFEFLSLLKLSRKIPTIDGIYIGLKVNIKEVSET